MITLVRIAISLTIGLVSLAYGQESNSNSNTTDCQMINELMKTGKFTESEAKDIINSQVPNLSCKTDKVNQPQTGPYSSLLNNGIIGQGDPEISCVTVSWMNQTSSSCKVLNWTDIKDDMENLGKSQSALPLNDMWFSRLCPQSAQCSSIDILYQGLVNVITLQTKS